jgi:hypothetical protein
MRFQPVQPPRDRLYSPVDDPRMGPRSLGGKGIARDFPHGWNPIRGSSSRVPWVRWCSLRSTPGYWLKSLRDTRHNLPGHLSHRPISERIGLWPNQSSGKHERGPACRRPTGTPGATASATRWNSPDLLPGMWSVPERSPPAGVQTRFPALFVNFESGLSLRTNLTPDAELIGTAGHPTKSPLP